MVTGLLAARTPLHRVARSVLTEAELEDALIFRGATLVVLPLLPGQALSSFGALNPRSIWIIVVLVMAVSSAGHVQCAPFATESAGISSIACDDNTDIGGVTRGLRRKRPDYRRRDRRACRHPCGCRIRSHSLLPGRCRPVTLSFNSDHTVNLPDEQDRCRSTNGSQAFAIRAVPGLILLIMGAWTGALAADFIEL